MLFSSFLRNRQIRYVMFLAGTSSFILPPPLNSRVRDLSCAKELCEVVYILLSALWMGQSFYSCLFSPCSQISSYSYQDAMCSTSNSLQKQLWTSTRMCTLIRSILIQSTLSFQEWISWEIHLLQLWSVGKSTLLLQLASSSTTPSEMKRALGSPYSG